MKCLFVIVVCAGVGLSGCERSQKQGKTLTDKTNLLLITLDTTRADRMGFHGHAAAKTPALDALSRKGVVFDDAHSAVPLTLPSHATILTGRFPREHGLRVNGRSQLGPTHPTLAKILKAKGFATAAFVSSFVLDGGYGLSRGFDVYDDEVTAVEPGEDIQEAERSAKLVTDRALAWLEKNSSSPFFAWVHYYDPHDPYEPPSPFREQLADPYDGEIAFMDSQIARLMSWLNAGGLSQRTLIVVAGDHGESFGEHAEFGHAIFVYETNLRVPLLFVHPDLAQPGLRIATPVSLVDLYPTLLDLYGIAKPDGLLGRSLAGGLFGGTVEPRQCYGESENVYSVHGWAQQRTLLTEEWKLVWSSRPELYDRRNDRPEKRNLARERPDLVQQLYQGLSDLYEQMIPAGVGDVPQSAEAAKRLESLGYVAGTGARPDELLSESLPDPKDMMDVVANLKTVGRYFDNKQFSEAIPLLEDAAKRSPQSVDILHRLGRAYLQVGRAQESIATLKQALKIDAGYRAAARTLADAAFRAGRLEEAIEHYRLSLDRLPEDPQTLFNLGTALSQAGKSDEAIARFKDALKLKPDYTEVMVNLAALLVNKGSLPEAEQLAKKALENPAMAAEAHAILAKIAAHRMDRANVLAHLEKAVSLKPGYSRAVGDLANLYLASKRTKDAVRILETGVKNDQDNVSLLLVLAEVLAISQHDDLRNGPEAVKLAQRAVEATQGRDLRALATLGEALAEAGDYEAAVQTAEKALAMAQAQKDDNLTRLLGFQVQEYKSRRPFRSPSF